MNYFSLMKKTFNAKLTELTLWSLLTELFQLLIRILNK